MATVTAMRPPPPAAAAVSVRRERAKVEPEGEHASAEVSPGLSAPMAAPADDDRGMDHASDGDGDGHRGRNGAADRPQQQVVMMQADGNDDVRQGSHEHQDEEDHHSLGLSLSSRSPSPPENRVSTSGMIPSIAEEVSREALTAAVEAAASSSAVVDASLLPDPRLGGESALTPSDISAGNNTQQHADASNPAGGASAGAASGASQTAQLEARIMQLERSLETVTQFCQSLMLQQQQHHRNGSEVYASGSSTPNTPLRDNSDLSQWPPAHHHLLESPDANVRHGRQFSSGRYTRQKRRTSSSSSTGKGLPSKGKTMSMVLLDIDPDESRGPNMIPFTSDLDACDEMDGDSVAGGCREGRGRRGLESSRDVAEIGRGAGSRSGGSRGSESPSLDSSSRSGSVEKKGTRRSSVGTDDGANSSSNESSSSSSSRGRHRGRRLSSSLKEPPENNLECQAYTTTHLEALRLRREAGKDRRAYSFNDSLTSENSKEEWTPTLGAVDGSVKEPDSAASTASFVEVPSSESKELDIIMPDLSLPDNATPLRKNRGKEDPKQAEMKSVGTSTTPSEPEIIAPSTSCASNMSSDTTKTLKSGNKLRAGSISLNSNSGKERSQSVSSSKSSGSAKDSSADSNAADSAAPPPPPLTAVTPSKATPSKRESKKGKSPHKHASQDKGKSPRKDEENSKNNQTMKEYVINDLLNIDSRNQDGSATEDIDANMEEFLRIPSKLENLMIFSLAVCMDSFLYAWAMLPLKFVWGWVCLLCSVYSPRNGIRGVKFHRRHLYPIMQTMLIYFVYSQVLCPISIGKLYHWIRGQAMLKLYVLIAIVEVFDRLLCSFGQDAWDSLYWNTTRRPRHPRMFVSIIVVGVYVTIHSLFLFVHVATLSVAVNSADNALLTLLISGNFAEIKSTVFKKYNKQNLFKITTSDICERFKLALFLLLILFLNRFQGEMTSSMVRDYYSMCGIVFAAELISDWIKHSFITKFNLIKSSTYFDYALVISGDVTGIGHEGLNLDYTHAAVKRLGLAQIPLVCVTARYLHEAIRFAIAFEGNGDVDHPVAALVDLVANGNKWKFYTGLMQGMAALVLFKIILGMCIRYVARGYLGGASKTMMLKTGTSSRKGSSTKTLKNGGDEKKKQ